VAVVVTESVPVLTCPVVLIVPPPVAVNDAAEAPLFTVNVPPVVKEVAADRVPPDTRPVVLIVPPLVAVNEAADAPLFTVKVPAEVTLVEAERVPPEIKPVVLIVPPLVAVRDPADAPLVTLRVPPETRPVVDKLLAERAPVDTTGPTVNCPPITAEDTTVRLVVLSPWAVSEPTRWTLGSGGMPSISSRLVTREVTFTTSESTPWMAAVLRAVTIPTSTVSSSG